MIKSWSDEAWNDFEYWLSQDKRTFKKIIKLIQSIDRNGYNCICRDHILNRVNSNKSFTRLSIWL